MPGIHGVLRLRQPGTPELDGANAVGSLARFYGPARPAMAGGRPHRCGGEFPAHAAAGFRGHTPGRHLRPKRGAHRADGWRLALAGLAEPGRGVRANVFSAARPLVDRHRRAVAGHSGRYRGLSHGGRAFQGLAGRAGAAPPAASPSTTLAVRVPRLAGGLQRHAPGPEPEPGRAVPEVEERWRRAAAVRRAPG